MVLSIEQNLSNDERIKQQKKYVHLMNNNEKALIVRWKQNVTIRLLNVHITAILLTFLYIFQIDCKDRRTRRIQERSKHLLESNKEL